MKCLACKKGTLKLANYDNGKRTYAKAHPRGLLVCNSCGYKEVI